LRGTTILEELNRSHPGRFDDRVLRTLQRRLARWRAIDGPEHELIFRQEHPPGWQGLAVAITCPAPLRAAGNTGRLSRAAPL